MKSREIHLRNAIMWLLLIFLSTTFSSALAPDHAVELEAEPAVQDFVRGHGAAIQSALGRPLFSNLTLPAAPTVYVYSPSGEMVYAGEGEAREANYALLRSMPESLKELKPIAGKPKLKDMLDFIPVFKAHEDEILKDHHYVVYAITWKTDHVSNTEQAILAMRAKAKDTPIDSLIVRMIQ